jgi:hypothetical protein
MDPEPGTEVALIQGALLPQEVAMRNEQNQTSPKDGTRMPTLLAVPALLVLFLSVAATPAHAQYGDAAADVDAIALPEGSSWARVRHVEGQVTLLQDRAETNDDLGLNAPVTPGDILQTGRDGRIEIQLADGSVIWLDGSARLSVQALADGQSQFENRTLLSLENGNLIIEVEPFEGADKVFRVDTEAATVFLLEAGLYRIDAGTSGGTRVTSRRGVAEVLGVDGSVLVRSGEGNFTAPGYAPEDPRVASVRRGDDFDAFVNRRRDIYLSRGGGSYIAYEDEIPVQVQPYLVELDAYGSWQRHPTYGAVWVPAVDAGWRPYYRGYWATRPVGNVWVSYDAWGYAPYHYGRWEYLPGYGWSWMPGGLYAPAWVSWGYYGSNVGWSPIGWYNYPCGWNISLSFGAFHGSYWNFVPYNHFYHRHVNTVLIKDRIIAGDVTFASRPPRVSRGDVRARREEAIFANARTEARQAKGSPNRGRESDPARTASFRQREEDVTVARARGRSAGPPSSGRADLPLARTPGRSSTPTSPDLGRRAVPSRPSAAASPRTVRSRTSGDTSAPTTVTGGRERGRVPSRTTSGSRDTGRSSAVREKVTTRQVPAREPRRILTDTRTRRTPAGEDSPTTSRGRTQGEESRRPTASSGSSRDTRAEPKPAPKPPTPSPRANPRSSGSSSKPPEANPRSSGSSSKPPERPSPSRRSGDSPSRSKGRSGGRR